MRRAGFVLTGGRSSRMGRDKALLAVSGQPLACRVAEEVLAAAGEVTLIGDPARYGRLGYPAAADLVKERGPAGGLCTALTLTRADWNLIVACDMPEIRRADLVRLLSEAEQSPGGCLVPRETSGRMHALCAVYHRRCLPAIEAAIKSNILKMQEIISMLQPEFVTVSDPSRFHNLNTPEDWTHYSYAR